MRVRTACGPPPLWNIGRDQNRWDAYPEQVETKWGINAHFAMRAGSPRLTRKRVIVDAAVLVPEDSQQGLFPQRGIPNCLEYVCNQHVSQADIVVGVLVVCRFEGKAEIAGLD